MQDLRELVMTIKKPLRPMNADNIYHLINGNRQLIGKNHTFDASYRKAFAEIYS